MGQESILSKFTDYTKLGEVVDISDKYAAVQTDFNKTENWVDRHEGKCQVLYLFTLGLDWLKTSFV